jgi:predicted ATPase
MDLELDEEFHPPPPEMLARGIRRSYVSWIERLAADRPVVVALDDLQWADPSTRELSEDLLTLTDRAPLLVAAAFRPEPRSEGWRLRMRVLSDFVHRAVELPLVPLATESAEKLLDALMPLGLLDPATKGDIVARAEGNPLYLEELLRAVLESGIVDRKRTWTLPTSSASFLPPSLEGLFIARIDRLPPEARRLAQSAAVVGRSFPVRILERLHPQDDVHSGMKVLLRSEIVRELRRYPELECTFRHGLLQDAALSTLPPARRREMYGAVARAFEDIGKDSLEDHLERLALYYYRSGEQRKALHYLERAAERAAALDARPQAMELWAKGMKVASRLGDDEAKRRLALRLEQLEHASR